MWKNVSQPGRQQMAIWHVCNACQIPKATNMLSEYGKIIAFLLQQWWQNHTSVSHNMYIACQCAPWKQPLSLSSFACLWTKSLIYEELLIFINKLKKNCTCIISARNESTFQ
jgi:hypothetical protein